MCVCVCSTYLTLAKPTSACVKTSSACVRMIANLQLTSRPAVPRPQTLPPLNRQQVCAGGHRALKSSCEDGRVRD